MDPQFQGTFANEIPTRICLLSQMEIFIKIHYEDRIKNRRNNIELKNKEKTNENCPWKGEDY